MKRILILAVLALVLLAPAGMALAADDNASCPGLGISDHASAGEMPETLQEVKEFLSGIGVNPGAFVSRFAKVHAGTHDPGCEEAAEEIIADLAGA